MSPEDRARLRATLEQAEGRRTTAYQDSRGVWTVGVGHNLAVPLSDAVVDHILAEDILVAEKSLLDVAPWAFALEPARLAVFVELAFNMGGGGLAGFHRMLEAAQAGDWARAGAELLDSAYAKQVGRRAERLAAQLEGDRWA